MHLPIPDYIFIRSINLSCVKQELNSHIYPNIALTYLIDQLTVKAGYRTIVLWFLNRVNRYESTHT